MSRNINLSASLLFLYIGSFPFINFGIKFDTLPIFLSMFLLCINKFKGKTDFIIITFLISICLVSISIIGKNGSSEFLIARGMINKITALAAFIVAYNCIEKNVDLEKHLKFLNIIYLLAAAVQLYNPAFLEILIKGRTGEGRGVNSLTVEPSMFALVSLVFLVLSLQFKNKYTRVYWATINTFSVVFLSKSALGMLLLLVLLCVQFCRINRSSIGILFIIIFSVLFIGQLDFWEGSRVAKLFITIADRGVIELIFHDSSISGRLLHLVCSNLYSVTNYGFPNGVFTFDQAYNSCNEALFDNKISRDASLKIMSLFGSILYELGPFATILIVLILMRNKLKYVGSFRNIVSFGLIGSMAFTHGFVPLFLICFMPKN